VIQTAKALYRKRHMAWILQQLAAWEKTKESAPSSKPLINSTVRQAIEWFMIALGQLPKASVHNCWVACKILTPVQMVVLSTGIRHNNRAARSEMATSTASVSNVVCQELSDMLSQMGKSLAVDKSQPVRMAEAVDVLNLTQERAVFDSDEALLDEVDRADHATGVDSADDPMDEEGMEVEVGGDSIPIDEDVDVDEKEPEKIMSLDEARIKVDRLYAFVAENSVLVDQALSTRACSGVFMADSLRVALLL
jgi:hypothetical protein